MITFKCKMCGGDLHPEENATTCECEYCGSVQTIPTADNEKKMNLFGRAQRLLRACEFDKAAGVYESIVAEFPEEAEAYWGLVLCKYGIEYVDDPATGKKVPTCHRSSFDSVMDDANFEQACENADTVARRVYREEAKAIEELRRRIIEVSGKEQPYDIFICYKETDEKGERTLDSVLAQDIYNELTDKGYRVFFSRITLEDKLGQEYEPYIFAALNSAKVMLAVGTDYEYYNAVWVKNEWSRFLKMIAAGQKKTLIPCYKGIDAYDMPKEFARLQAQDLGKVGAMQDLVRGIEKIIPHNTEQETASQQTAIQIAQPVTPTTKSLMERSFAYLEDSEWEKAIEYADKVLDIDISCGRAYLAKLMADLKVNREEELKNLEEPFENQKHYQKIMRFGDETLKKQVTDANCYIKERSILNQATNALSSATTIEQCAEVEKLLESIKDFDGAAEKLADCREKEEAIVKAEERVKALKENWSALRETYNAQMETYRNAESRLMKAQEMLNKKRQELTQAKDTLSRLESELQNLSGLFTGKRRRVLVAEITEAKTRMRAAEEKVAEQEKVYEDARVEMPVKPEPSSCMEEQELIYQCAGIYAEAGILLMALHEYGRIRGYKNVDYIILNLVSGHSTAENTINIIMPRVSNTTKNCVITEWKKKVGDLIEKDDILFNYENDKAAYEYRYEFDNQGVLVEVLFNEGDKVPVLEKVGVIEIV